MVRSLTSWAPRARSASVKARLACACVRLPLRLVERGLERPLVDGEQEVALLDHLAVGEMDGVEISGHPGAHLDAVDGDEPADIFVLIDHAALDRRGDGHLRRRRRRALLRRLAAASERDEDCQQERASAGERPHDISVGVTGTAAAMTIDGPQSRWKQGGCTAQMPAIPRAWRRSNHLPAGGLRRDACSQRRGARPPAPQAGDPARSEHRDHCPAIDHRSRAPPGSSSAATWRRPPNDAQIADDRRRGEREGGGEREAGGGELHRRMVLQPRVEAQRARRASQTK